MIRGLLALLAGVLGDVDDEPAECECGAVYGPCTCIDQPGDDVDLVPATCDDCGGPIGIVCCDLSDSLEYLEAANR